MSKEFIPKAIGTNADMSGQVNIQKVHSGYFDNREYAIDFVKKGVEPLIPSLSQIVNYADCGGAHGLLAEEVTNALRQLNFTVNPLVVDANSKMLELAKERNLPTLLANLDDVPLEGMSLITMRAVLHYNSADDQLSILHNMYNSLLDGGHLVHQASSGNEENCALRSEIVNLPSLGRAGAGKYSWLSLDKIIEFTRSVGFTVVDVEYAQSNAWSAEEQWDRFNSAKLAEISGNESAMREYFERRDRFLTEANALIKKAIAEYGAERLGVELKSNGEYMIHYPYPIIVAKK
ncbi:MAG: class I SAM-dependent methyltransferase [Janthinobacterium sp.]|jgi:hypothetical protein